MTPQTLAGIYPDLQTSKCREGGCSVQLNYLVSYCGELLRDQVFGNGDTQIKMCDCIVTDISEIKFSLVELKARKSRNTKLNFRLVNQVREQLSGGVLVLREVLKRTKRQEIYLQLVLFTQIDLNRSEIKKLREPLHGLPDKITVINRTCGCDIPDGYQRVKIKN